MSMGKYTFYGMGLRANTHSTEYAYGQIHVLRNAPLGKYTFYKMCFRANTHSTECTSGQIHILQNTHRNKYVFYEMCLRVNIHSIKCAYGKIYEFYWMHQWANKHFTKWAYRLTNIMWNALTGKILKKAILFVRNQYKCWI